ncbi:MAG: sensor histidine kinase [Actinomycetota bacterium]
MSQTTNAKRLPGGTEEQDAVATIAHELRTPLTSLMGYARMMRHNWEAIDAGRRADMFDVIEEQGRRILRLVEHLLEAARVGAGMSELRREPLDVHAIVAAAVRTVEGLDSHHIRVDVPAGDLDVFGDAMAIEHVLTNLLENAMKYSPEGSTVFVVAGDAGAEVRVSVRDQGSGIATKEIPHVFDRFRRADDSGAQGVGLGLYIVRGLVAAHGGRVWLQSPAGVGTTVTFSLPRRSSGPR